MIRIECCKKDWRSELDALCNRPAYPPAAEKAAAEIIADIRARGVEAICEYAEKFDHVKLTFDQFRISEEEIEAALAEAGINEDNSDEDTEEEESEETDEETGDVAESETSEEASEETPKPKKRRSKKVTAPEELEVKNEETECESQEFSENEELAENEIVCEHTEG